MNILREIEILSETINLKKARLIERIETLETLEALDPITLTTQVVSLIETPVCTTTYRLNLDYAIAPYFFPTADEI